LSIKSKFLREFIKEIQYNNRNPKDTKALELLDDISTNPEIVINMNTSLYRSRIVSDESKINKEKNFYGYNAKDSFIPPAKLTKDLRANYRYIPYLYCANHSYIALVETRPRMGALVSVATIVNDEPIRLLDFTIQNKPSKMSEAKKNLFLDLSTLFSTPVTNDDDILDYIPTQFIAEYAKNIGYDGIAFSSSLTPYVNKNNPDRYNIVIFNYNKCRVIKSNTVKIMNVDIECMQIDDDTVKLNTKSFIEEQLDEIIGIQNEYIVNTREA